MEIYKHSRNEDIQATQSDITADFQKDDTWGLIRTVFPPEQAEREFMAAIYSGEAEQRIFEKYVKENPGVYRDNHRIAKGKVEYSVFPGKDGTRIVFLTDYAQAVMKKICTKKNFGQNMKIKTAQARHQFHADDVTGQNTWYFVAYSLVKGAK